MKNIMTGADRLVQLIAEKKKVSLDDASKILNVEKDVLREWAEFLEQEGHISIDYKFSKVWLQERKITKNDVISSAKEVYSEKEAFERKVGVIIRNLENETEGFDKIKQEFAKIQDKLKAEIETVKEQSRELEKFEDLKKNIDKDIEKQQKEYESKLNTYKTQIANEKKNIDELEKNLDSKNKKLESLLLEIRKMEDMKENFTKEIKEWYKKLEEIEKSIKSKKSEFKEAVKEIESAKKNILAAKADMHEIKNKYLVELDKELEISSTKIIKSQEDLLRIAKQNIDNIKNHSQKGAKMFLDFENTIKKKIDAQKIFDDIEKEKALIISGLEELKKKIRSFTIVNKNFDAKEEMKDIEKKILEFEKRKEGLSVKISSFMNILKSK